MCGGSPSVDTTVQDQMLEDSRIARADEEARQQRIRSGTEEINETFSGFNDGFFDNYKNTYMDFYRPEIDRKHADAQDQLTYALARAGTLNSSMAGERQAKLGASYDTNIASTVSQAADAAAGLQGNINNEKSSLISLLNATGDADSAANNALARSQQLYQSQPSYNPLGDIFAGAASGIGGYYAGNANRAAYNTYFGTGGSGSGRMVN